MHWMWKNSLNFNYLADAKAHGAHIFTKVGTLEVKEVCRVLIIKKRMIGPVLHAKI